MRIGVLLAFNFLLWLIVSNDFSFYYLSCGAICSLIVAIISNRLSDIYTNKFPSHPKIILYLCWLVGEIIVSSIGVVRKIWGKEASNPGFKLIKTPLSIEQNFIYANSITLTPGTVAVDLGENTILVHGLERGDLELMENGTMESRISKLC